MTAPNLIPSRLRRHARHALRGFYDFLDSQVPETDGSIAVGASGIRPVNLPLTEARLATGLPLTSATASSSSPGLAATLGTSILLTGTAAHSGAATSNCLWSFDLPDEYTAGKNLTVSVTAKIATADAGATSAKTVQVKAYRDNGDGTLGTDIGPGSSVAMPAVGTAGTSIHTITGTSLKPGDRVIIEVLFSYTENAANNVHSELYAVTVS